MPLNPKEAELELATAFKWWKNKYLGKRQRISAEGRRLNIEQQFVNPFVGNNPNDRSTHDIDQVGRMRLIRYWQTWNPNRRPNSQVLNYQDIKRNFYNVEGSFSGGKGVIHFVYKTERRQKFNWHFRVV